MANCSSFQLHLVELLVSLVYEGIGQRFNPLVLVLSLIGLSQLPLSCRSHWLRTSELDLALRSLGYHLKHRPDHIGHHLLPPSERQQFHCFGQTPIRLVKQYFTV